MEHQKHLDHIKRLRTGISNIEFLENRVRFLEGEGHKYAGDLINARGQLVKEIERYTELKDQYCKLQTE